MHITSNEAKDPRIHKKRDTTAPNCDCKSKFLFRLVPRPMQWYITFLHGLSGIIRVITGGGYTNKMLLKRSYSLTLRTHINIVIGFSFWTFQSKGWENVNAVHFFRGIRFFSEPEGISALLQSLFCSRSSEYVQNYRTARLQKSEWMLSGRVNNALRCGHSLFS